jgi:hypothetical protein
VCASTLNSQKLQNKHFSRCPPPTQGTKDNAHGSNKKGTRKAGVHDTSLTSSEKHNAQKPYEVRQRQEHAAKVNQFSRLVLVYGV